MVLFQDPVSFLVVSAGEVRAAAKGSPVLPLCLLLREIRNVRTALCSRRAFIHDARSVLERAESVSVLRFSSPAAVHVSWIEPIVQQSGTTYTARFRALPEVSGSPAFWIYVPETQIG